MQAERSAIQQEKLNKSQIVELQGLENTIKVCSIVSKEISSDHKMNIITLYSKDMLEYNEMYI